MKILHNTPKLYHYYGADFLVYPNAIMMARSLDEEGDSGGVCVVLDDLKEPVPSKRDDGRDFFSALDKACDKLIAARNFRDTKANFFDNCVEVTRKGEKVLVDRVDQHTHELGHMDSEALLDRVADALLTGLGWDNTGNYVIHGTRGEGSRLEITYGNEEDGIVFTWIHPEDEQEVQMDDDHAAKRPGGDPYGLHADGKNEPPYDVIPSVRRPGEARGFA